MIRATSLPVIAAALALLAACAEPAPEVDFAEGALAEAARRAQGGAVERFSRRSEIEMHYGFPGTWRWQIAYRAPDSLRLTLHARGEDQHYVLEDGRLTSFVGGTRLASDEGAGAEAWTSQARWQGLVSLALLREDTGFAWEEVPESWLPEGTARGLLAWLETDPADRFALLFDARGRLVQAEGPVAIAGLGRVVLLARYSDFRAVGRHTLPFRVRYRINGEPLLDERVEEQRIGASAAPVAPPRGPARASAASPARTSSSASAPGGGGA